MNFIVGLSAFWLSFKALKTQRFLDSFAALFIFYFSQIIITELLLGILGILFIDNLILLNIAICLIIWLGTKNSKVPKFGFSDIKNNLEVFSNNKVITLVTSVIIVFGLVKIFINLVNPPFGWDSLNYHFTFPVEWLKHGNLYIPITICDEPGPSYYPLNGSLFFLWLIFPLRNVFLADIGQVPFFILAFLAVYSLARKINLNKDSAYLSACLFTLIPNYFKQLQIAYVDVMVAALFLVGLNFLFAVEKEFSWQNNLIFGLSLGLLLGTKTVALPYSLLLLVPYLYFCLRNINKGYLLSVTFSALILLGGYTYIRNFLDTGNPLYPLNVNIWGNTIFKGVMDHATYAAHFKLGDYRIAKLLFHEGLGVQTLIFIFPSLFLALPLTLLKRRKALSFNFTFFLILPFLIYSIYRYLIPLANTRYLYPLLGVGIIIGVYTFNILNFPRVVINTLIVICALTSASELAKRTELVTSIILTILLFSSFKFIIKIIKKLWSRSFLIFILVLITCSLIFLNRYYIANEYPRYTKMVKYSGFWPDATRAWDWLNSYTVGNNIAYVGRPVPFPLYGTNFKNNVYYVSVNKTDPVKLHYFPNGHYQWGYDFLSLHRNMEEKGNYRGSANYSTWLANLLRRNTDYLFAYSLHQTKEIEFPIEDRWANSDPKRFKPVFTNSTIHIYRILK
jgi:hypothetical protein